MAKVASYCFVTSRDYKTWYVFTAGGGASNRAALQGAGNVSEGVHHLLGRGWQPLGGLSVDGDNHSQAMVRYEGDGADAEVEGD